jgi:hypothetical protein
MQIRYSKLLKYSRYSIPWLIAAKIASCNHWFEDDRRYINDSGLERIAEEIVIEDNVNQLSRKYEMRGGREECRSMNSIRSENR